ncbi:glycosyltransferase family 2 protein [Candidatus Parcubacteria bacterium]|nr:MAG: glycosyltransferase family 2 protein [Candidatus Parcubacteria bacterium]
MKDGPLFFSIVIPAHNEERYIERTLESVMRLEYPREHFEVIVVENGSTDDTYTVAKRFERDNIRILTSDKGVSKAKNVGVDNASKESDWFIFLDADTILERAFLREFDAFLKKRPEHTVGTVSVSPLPDTHTARIWFAFYDIGHQLTKTAYSIKMVRRDLFPPIRFDEALVAGEDLHVIAQARHFGKFFFMRTKNVFTSTRRFEQLGWWYVFFTWTFVAALPEKWQRHFTYKVVR